MFGRAIEQQETISEFVLLFVHSIALLLSCISCASEGLEIAVLHGHVETHRHKRNQHDQVKIEKE